MMKKLDRNFYDRDTLIVAKELLGKCLVHRINGKELAGMIVEVEAYIGPFDKAAHSYNNRRSERNEVMYGPAGYAYVYMIYGRNYCMNVVTEHVEKPSAVLIRALEPVQGLDEMAQNRFGRNYNDLDRHSAINLTNGPGKLCSALGIDKSNNGEDLCGNTLYITVGKNENTFTIATSKRINIGYAEEAIDFPWRFYIKGNTYVSRPHE